LLHPLYNRRHIRPGRNHFALDVIEGPTGERVPGASVVLSDTATGSANHAVANRSGYYVFSGCYIIALEES
jgi:hypothetical protein